MKFSEILSTVRAAQSLTSFFERGYAPPYETFDKAGIPREMRKYWKR